ncbi:tetratricopeptide repeat protein [Polynucleobacter sp. UB-Tiil-W10]|uniref:tetratricopeptide repeat protein n=1 Tax=Polynucleobacter sp. UB-Tiil-W10 TaxID=1855648 RepID=UPI001C0C79C3|nr:tetratricopeptide repeat protein [Polynucleobacter sp. UB-Tiil-W10]MBU3540598.1 tetratricopeptide repeat protein [Polynucleobacter sp. UB-Tiil-W10]
MQKDSLENSLHLARQHFQAKDYQATELALGAVLAENSDHAGANELLAYIAASTGDAERFHSLLLRAGQQSDCSAQALYYLGSSFLERGQFEHSILYLDRAINMGGEFFEALHDIATAQAQMGDTTLALQNYTKALQLKKDSPELHYNVARLYDELDQLDLALAHYKNAVQIEPRYAEAWCNLGVDLARLRRYEEALYSYEKSLILRPNDATTWSNKGITLCALKKFNEALIAYDQAIRLRPEYAQAWANKASSLHDQKQYPQAIAAYEEALRLNPGIHYVAGEMLHAKMKICDWNNLNAEINDIQGAIAANQLASSPFPMVVASASESINFQVATLFAKDQFPVFVRPKFHSKSAEKKIRIAYYSNDFFNHATAYLMAELFELHDREHFEVLAFSFGPNTQDAMQVRLQKNFDQFIDISAMSDQEVTALSRRMEVDIAIDLKGYTTNSRPEIFALGAAPLQINYLGYPGTMGAEFMDYIIADRVLIPECNQQYFSEKIIYLKNCYQVNDSRREISNKKFSRSDFYLPENKFVFCCFNNNFKILPTTLDLWARILSKVPNSVLWLLEDNLLAKQNLIFHAESRGIAKERLIFAKRMDLPEHLARHQLADLFLDTLPCNAHTTASDALWAGLPVLTQLGETLAGRVAGSLLTAMSLPELIARSPEKYEDLAVELATNLFKLKQIQEKLLLNRLSTPLFDAELFTRGIEDAFIKIYQHYQMGLPPEHLYL